MTRIYAHRGVSAELPENTIPAFERALELGVFGIELDVHLSRDGIPVVIHDETVNRTTDGVGAVSSLEVAELQRLDAGGARIPTLGEVLDLAGNWLHVDIEVKAATAADAVLAETGRRPDLRFAISSFSHDVLRHVRSIANGTELWPITNMASDEALVAATELQSPCIAIDARFLNREIVDYVRSRGTGCWAWTVNDPARAAELVALGVVGLCTDDPASIMASLEA